MLLSFISSAVVTPRESVLGSYLYSALQWVQSGGSVCVFFFTVASRGAVCVIVRIYKKEKILPPSLDELHQQVLRGTAHVSPSLMSTRCNDIHLRIQMGGLRYLLNFHHSCFIMVYLFFFCLFALSFFAVEINGFTSFISRKCTPLSRLTFFGKYLRKVSINATK